MQRRLLLWLFLLAAHYGRATPLPPDTLRPVSPDRLLTYTYTNDLFFGTDYYFTQGMTLDFVHPALARSLVNRLLAKGPVGNTQYHGIRLRYDGFTPLRIQDAFVRVGDRPYAAYLYASLYRVANQPRQRLTTAVEIGFIGPAAGGKELQTQIHEITHNDRPLGWDHQISNDLVLGYRARYEKLLLATPGAAELLGTAEASLGTLYTYGSAGLHLRAGHLNPYFANLGAAGPSSRTGLHRWQAYFESTAEIRAVGHDASLQGGVLNRSSPYVIAASDVQRAVLRGTAGFVLAHDGLRFTLTATQVSPEFAGGRWHRWGQLGLTVAW